MSQFPIQVNAFSKEQLDKLDEAVEVSCSMSLWRSGGAWRFASADRWAKGRFNFSYAGGHPSR